MDSAQLSSSAPRPGRRFLLIAFLLVFLGPAIYAAMVAGAKLKVPWYLPIMTTVAFLMSCVAWWKARSVFRSLATGVMLLLAGAQWAFVFGTGSPKYDDTLSVGGSFPYFTCHRADGTEFWKKSLEGDQTSVLVSFRGRW